MTAATQSAFATDDMLDPNLAYLDAELRLLELQLEELTETGDAGKTETLSQETREERARLEAFLQDIREKMSQQSSQPKFLKIACAFRLSDFERRLLLLAASADLD